jgi:hypothetical protein
VSEKLKVRLLHDILQRTMDEIAEMRMRLVHQGATTAQAVTDAKAALVRLQRALAVVAAVETSNTGK